MGRLLEESLGDPVGLVDRVAALVAESGWSTRSDSHLETAANRLLAVEAPRAAPGVLDGVIANVVGLGPIEPLARDESVTDILVNGPAEVWVDRGGTLELTDVKFASSQHLMATVERALAGLGLRVDRSSPMVDGRLRDGSRIHVAIPPATVDYPVVAIRRFSQAVKTFGQLVTSGTATQEEVDLLTGSARGGQNIIVSGGTGAGKTTILNLLASEIPHEERLVTVEDAAELQFQGHVVRLEAHPANAEGFGEVTIRQLLRAALRLRPDRIILGEVRGVEALDLITALNTGHPGSMSTVHAKSPEEARWRIEALALFEGAASRAAVQRQLAAAVDLVVQIARLPEGRKITSIARVARDGSLEVANG
jgi:pilus assembly protein CpaF